MTEKKTETKKTSGTLSLGTLSVGASKGASKASGSGVAVEVKKRRFSQGGNSTVSAAQTDNAEMARRLQALEEAKKNQEAEEAKREEERKRAEELARKQSADAEQRRIEEERVAAEAEAKKVAAEKAPEKDAASEDDVIAAQQAAAQKAENARHRTKAKEKKEKTSSAADKRGGRNSYREELENRYRAMPAAGRQKKAQSSKGGRAEPQEKVIREVVIPEVITIQELAVRMSEKVSDVVKKMMLAGQMVTQNQSVDQETAALIVEEMGHTYKMISDADVEENLSEADANPEAVVERAPIVTVMGHVDHGKTSLLDALRHAHVVDGEAGGITQHIGAYQVRTESGRFITFVDTPGHEAFTSMRARGASVTDIVILVVAADDGVMPQTVEAIHHAKAAGVPIIVAVNKCDKPEANPDRVKQELLNYDLIPEDFGGDIVCVNISAKQRMGLEDLEEMIILQSDVLELKANKDVRAEAIVVESRLDKGRGSVASVIVQRGTLSVGDVFVAGSVWGRVRALMDDKGNRLKSAGPAMPVEIQGLQGVADAGDQLNVTEDERKAREIADYRDRKKREKAAAANAKTSLDTLFSKIAEGSVAKLPVVVKGDVQGSVEAIADALAKLSTDEVKVQVIHGAVGVITENDVNLASASDALIMGFNVRANAQARDAAEAEGVEIRYYNVIYSLVDDVKAAMTGMLSPDYEEKVTGRAEIRQVMIINKNKISGSYVTDGKFIRGGKVRIIRDGVVVHDGEISSLRRFKDEVKEVLENYECGMTFVNFDDVKDGDEVECYEMVEVKRTLDDVKREEAAKEKAAIKAKEEAELAAIMGE